MTQIIGKTPIMCDALKKIEGPVDTPPSHPFNKDAPSTFRQYSFDELINQKFIILSQGHNVPLKNDRKGKEYRK